MSRRLYLIATVAAVTGWGGDAALAQNKDARITQEMERMILDKPAIAEEFAERMIGLQESGNPHIPTGSLLKKAKLAEPRGAEYEEELYQRRLAMFGNREPNWQHLGPASVSAKPKTEVVDSEKEERDRKHSIFSAVAAGIACLMVIGLFVQSRSQR